MTAKQVADRLCKHEERDLALRDALRELYPVGVFVKWRHGRQWRMGEVVDFRGMDLRSAAYRIRSVGQREYWVPAQTVLGAMLEQ